MQPSSQRPARLEPTSSRKNRRTFLSCRLFGPSHAFVSHEAAPFFKLPRRRRVRGGLLRRARRLPAAIKQLLPRRGRHAAFGAS